MGLTPPSGFMSGAAMAANSSLRATWGAALLETREAHLANVLTPFLCAARSFRCEFLKPDGPGAAAPLSLARV
eukprot:5663062-Alexandrium_andersonii.AAC.1